MHLDELLETKYLPRRIGIGRGAYNLRHALAVYSSWLGRRALLTDLTDDSLSTFLAAYAATHAGATTNTIRGKLLAVWRFAWRTRLTETLPRSVARAPERPTLPEAWTCEQVSALLRAAAALEGWVGRVPAAEWWPAVVATFYWTASRPRALFLATPDDFDRAGWLLLRNTKNGRPQLHALPDCVVVMLLRILDPAADRLFVWPHGFRYLWTRFRMIVEAAGLPAPRSRGRNLFYRLRRTTLSYAWRESPEAARQLAGHSSQRLTELHYIDPRIAGDRRVLALLPNIEIR